MAFQGRRGGGGGQRRGVSPTAPQGCPDCGSDMYDNSETKTGRQPDYVCKDPQCRKGVWITDTERNAAQAVAQPREPAPGAPQQPQQQQRKLLVIDKAMELALKAAKKLAAEEFPTVVSKEAGPTGGLPADLIVNLATTMYISRVRDRVGVFKAEKEALTGAQQKAKEAAENARREAEEARARVATAPSGPDYDDPMYSPNDDDLPF